MNKIIRITLLAISVIFTLIGFISIIAIIFNKSYRFNETPIIDPELASNFGDFFGGLIGTIFSIVSVFLLIHTIIEQNQETQRTNIVSNFFRMIDYHNINVNQLKIAHLDINKSNEIHEGRRAFVQFKIQIHRLFEIVRQINEEKAYNLPCKDIADIVYIIFYYGIDGSWLSFIEEKLSRYKNPELASAIQKKIEEIPNLKLARTNQTNLSAYFRNMYNAIKMVDESKALTTKQKKELIKILRAQLSNPELYVLFFNILSRFGSKWIKNNYVIKYEIIKNIPNNYCEGYNPNDYFPMKYEDEEY